MKNIHVLPTDKPSRLHFDGELFLSPNYQDSKTINSIVEGRNIYITSNEEIKDGDWVLNIEENTIFKPSNDEINDIKNSEAKYYEYCKKIILTTDHDLIKDGVQAIDDNFLEWFVKNPSCEFVDVKKGFADGTAWGYNFLDYKIIIPKEEAKFISGQPFLEKADEVIVIHRPKQETLEKAAHKILINYGIKSIGQSIGVLEVKKLMVNFAKWQQEQDKNNYSEEDMKKSFEAGKKGYMRGSYLTQEYYFTWNNFKLWFEQFKKK
jgi:hypothetical protein